MEDLITGIYIIGSILSIVCVIVFFVLASNVASIKNMIKEIRFDMEKTRKGITDEWECPKCKHKNPNNSYKCINCIYSLV